VRLDWPSGEEGSHVVPVRFPDAGDGVLATITVFETEQAAVDSTGAAAAWIRDNMPELAPSAPQVTAGSTTGVMAEVPA
jgi:hypothetical protein